MKFATSVRVLLLAVAVACSQPDTAPAQIDSSVSAFRASRDPAVRAAVEALDAGRPWHATEILDSAYRDPARRSVEATLMSATAAAAWGGWSRVERELNGAMWIDTAFAGQGRELLARAALARGSDSLAQAHAEQAVRSARSNRQRGVREVLLARALDRRALADSAASTYMRAAGHLPEIADWLALRAAGATPGALDRQRYLGRVSAPVAKERIRPTDAQARERWKDYVGAAKVYSELGEPAQALRVSLLATAESNAREKIRRDAFSLLGKQPRAADARVAVEMIDATFPARTPAEELVLAKAASTAGQLARAAEGFTRAARGALSTEDRYAFAMVLLRLGRDLDAARELARVPASSSLGAQAAYQRARALLHASRTSEARTALRRVVQTFAKDSSVVAPSLFLLADLTVDEGRDADARTQFLEMARRFPSSSLAPTAMFRAGVISFATQSFSMAARNFDTLVERHPQSIDANAARYWAGRAYERAGNRAKAAERWREVVAKDSSSYFAIRSSARLGTPQWHPAASSPPLIPRALEDAIRRASLLDDVGMGTEEGFEHDAIASVVSTSPDSLLAAAEAMRQRAEPSRAMSLARRALGARATRDARVYRLLYPVAYADVIDSEANARKIDPALVAALIHQESSFNPRATSRAGAVGLMQVLPSVGASIAKARGIPNFERVLLYQPDVNIKLGMSHLDAMLEQYPRVEYALAAYNAGGAPVRRWRALRGADDPELFVERISYDETRDYVRILLRNQAMYRSLYEW
jgi:soluble lytic murein transglycosylase